MVTVLEHPLITHKLALMRNKETGHKDFRENLDEIASLMAYEVCRDLPTEEVHIETPMGPCDTQMLSGEIILVPILRAGMGLVNGIMDLIPTAKVGFIGLYRDEKTLEPVEYFAKFPKELPDGIVLVLDPGNRRQCDCSCRYDQEKRCQEHPYGLSGRCTGRRQGFHGSTSGCRSVSGGFR